MTRITLQRGGFTYVYRIGKRTAEYFRWINGDLDTHNDEIKPHFAEEDVEELKRSGFGITDIRYT